MQDCLGNMPTKSQMSQQKLSRVSKLQSNLGKTNMGQQGLSRASSLRSSSSRTAAVGSGTAKTPKPRTHMGNKSKQKAKRSTKTRIKEVQKKLRRATKQSTIQSGLKSLTAQKGKLVTDSVKHKHLDQAIDDVVSGHVCQAGSNCTDPTALTDGPTMNVSSALIYTGMHANGTTEQIRATQNDSAAMQHNYSQQDVANQIPQNSRQQVTDVCKTEQPDVKVSLVQTQGATFTEEGLNNLITQIMEKTMSGLSGMGQIPVDVADGDSDVRRLMTIPSTATPAGANSSVNTQSLERENQVNGVSIGRPREDHQSTSMDTVLLSNAQCGSSRSGQHKILDRAQDFGAALHRSPLAQSTNTQIIESQTNLVRDSEINSSGALLSGRSQLRNEATGGEQVDHILMVQGKEQGMSVTRGSRTKCSRRTKTSCSSDDSSVEKTQRRQSLSRKQAQYRKEGRTQSIRSTSSSSSSSDYSIVDDERDSTDSSDWDETSSIDTSFEGVKTPRESRLLPPFTGQNEKWEVWFASFEDLAENHHWTKAECLSALVPLLHKKAGEFIFGSVSRRVRTNYKKLIRKLHMQYQTVESKKSYKLKWAELKQIPGQSIEELAAHVKWLHDKAFPD